MYSSMLYVPPCYFTPSHNDLPRFIEKFEVSVITYILRIIVVILFFWSRNDLKMT